MNEGLPESCKLFHHYLLEFKNIFLHAELLTDINPLYGRIRLRIIWHSFTHSQPSQQMPEYDRTLREINSINVTCFDNLQKMRSSPTVKKKVINDNEMSKQRLI